jgi:hypothetical protein
MQTTTETNVPIATSQGRREALMHDRCSHGKTWDEKCKECDLVWNREIVRRWAPVVEEAQRAIEEAEREGAA